MRLLILILSVLLGSVVMAFAEGNQDTVTVDDRVIPVVERLMGDFPVGRWQCWAEHRDLDVWGDSNKWFSRRDVTSSCTPMRPWWSSCRTVRGISSGFGPNVERALTTTRVRRSR